MTADLSTVKYKREAVPVIADEQKLKTYFSDELQRVENTLNNHELIVQSVSSEVDGNKSTFDQQIVTQANATSALTQSFSNLSSTVASGDAASAALVTQEATTRAGVDTAQALLISNLAATVQNGDDANIAAITAVSDAYVDADSAQTRVINAQRALFGAASADTWVLGAVYAGSVDSSSPSNALGDDVVVGGTVYRCRQNHTAANVNKPSNSSFWDAVDTVDAKVAAGVVTASGAHASAGYAAATSVTALSGRVTTAEGEIGANAADIVTANGLIVTANSVIAVDRDNTSARFGITVPNNYDSSKTYAVGEYAVYNALLYICIQAATGKIPSTQPLYWTFQTTVAADVAAAITTERTVRVSAEEAIADRTDVVSARIGVPPTGGTNFDSSRQYAIDDEVVHASGKVYKATAVPPVGTVPTNTSFWAEQSLLYATVAIAAQAAANAQGAVNAKFGVTLDSNGYVSGFESTNDGTTAKFQIAADKFSIRTPNTDSIPFQVDGNVVRMQNVEIGNNVIGLNSITHPHHATVTTAYASTLNAFTEVGSLAFTPTAAGEVLFVVNFNNAAVNASSQVTASARVDYSIQLRLTVGSGSESLMQGMNNLRIGGILTGHFGNSVLRPMSSSDINQLHTFKVYAKPTGFVSGAAKLGIYNLSMSATELYR